MGGGRIEEGEMNWSGWNDFWNMGGYALYVWGSYGVTLACLAGEIALVRRRRRSALAQLARYGSGSEGRYV